MADLETDMEVLMLLDKSDYLVEVTGSDMTCEAVFPQRVLDPTFERLVKLYSMSDKGLQISEDGGLTQEIDCPLYACRFLAYEDLIRQTKQRLIGDLGVRYKHKDIIVPDLYSVLDVDKITRDFEARLGAIIVTYNGDNVDEMIESGKSSGVEEGVRKILTYCYEKGLMKHE